MSVSAKLKSFTTSKNIHRLKTVCVKRVMSRGKHHKRQLWQLREEFDEFLSFFSHVELQT